MNTSPPQNVRFWSAFHLAVLYLLTIYFVTGCGPLEATGDFLFQSTPQANSLSEVNTIIDEEIVSLQKWIDTHASSPDKPMAEKQLANLKKLRESGVVGAETPADLLATVLGGLGVPGVGLGLYLWKRMRFYRKAVQQTADGVAAANPNGLNPTLATALSKTQDSDVKKLIDEIVPKKPLPGGPISPLQ